MNPAQGWENKQAAIYDSPPFRSRRPSDQQQALSDALDDYLTMFSA
jgi:hypothetical protein